MSSCPMFGTQIDATSSLEMTGVAARAVAIQMMAAVTMKYLVFLGSMVGLFQNLTNIKTVVA